MAGLVVWLTQVWNDFAAMDAAAQASWIAGTLIPVGRLVVDDEHTGRITIDYVPGQSCAFLDDYPPYVEATAAAGEPDRLGAAAMGRAYLGRAGAKSETSAPQSGHFISVIGFPFFT